MLPVVANGPSCWLVMVGSSLSGLTILRRVNGDKGVEKHGFLKVRLRAFSGVLGLAWLATCVRTRNQLRGEPCSASRQRAPSWVREAAWETMCCNSGEAEWQRNSIGCTGGVCRACMGHSRVLRDKGWWGPKMHLRGPPSWGLQWSKG
jgi:hypothetical protein